ncbi:PREDICTED: tektin-3-like [Priapulus caudatus]|uniref:Tektin n=1 Tax=Priapulus caudatus TaxID=37621 RepID=A0ABM1EUC9_PRICU|nr:PREDICTED: tektin-3-like [Priapulus caudatus]
MLARSTPAEWLNASLSIAAQASGMRNSAEKLRFETVRLIRDADEKTRMTQADAGQKLGNRISDISYWKSELLTESDKMVTEINVLSDFRRRLDKSLQEMNGPLEIAEECLRIREQRQNIDLVHDNAERELIREVNLAKECKEKMTIALDRIDAQMRLNRDRAVARVRHDDKQMALVARRAQLQAEQHVTWHLLPSGVEQTRTLLYEIAENQQRCESCGNKLKRRGGSYQRLQEMKDCLQRDLKVKNKPSFVDR